MSATHSATAELEHPASDPYASRMGSDWELAERLDPVIWNERPDELSDDLAQRFDRDGFLFLPELFSTAEVEKVLDEAGRLASEWPADKPGLVREPDSDVVRSIFRLHRISPLMRSIFEDPRVLTPVKQLLASEVYVHQSRINYKPALDGREFFWHSDFETWHVEDGMPRMRAISMSLLLSESHEFNGPLMLVPGSHKRYIRCPGETPENHFQQSLKKQQFGVPTREALELLVQEGGIVAPKGPAGSVILFDCNTMHGSSGNLSPTPRTNLFAVYNSVENQLAPPFGPTKPRPDYLAERQISDDDIL